MGQAESFRRAKSECLFAIQSGPPGPGCAKIAADAVPHLRLSLPNQRARSVGAAFGRPQAHTAWPCLRGRFFSAVGATLAVARKPSPGGRLPLSRGRFPLSGGNGRRPKGVGMMSRSDRGDRERWHGEAVADEGTMIERFRSSQGDFAACGRRVTLPTAARRRKVHSTPFPPGGENCVRSLAPPLPGEPASLGFAGSNEGLGKTPPGTRPTGTPCP